MSDVCGAGARGGGLPVVALAGRPNVGKSTLFNRLTHSRRVITEPTPGVTRDPVAMEALVGGRRLRLVDTGGFKADFASARGRAEGAEAQCVEELDAVVVERTLRTIREAALVVLVLEGGEFTPEDEEFCALLRPQAGRVIVAVNKCEGGRREAESWNSLPAGFGGEGGPIFISAEHGDNVGALEAAIARRLGEAGAEAARSAGEEERPVRLAIVGKPNTGKSTLSNRLTGSTASIVSAVPGTTRDVLEGAFVWKGRPFEVCDTAGIRRRTQVTENIEYYSVNRAIKSMERADVVILLIDAVDGLTEQDKKIAALACERGRAVILALNKWDTMPQVGNAFNAARDRIRYFFGKMEWAPVVALSARDGTGVAELLNTALRLYGQLTRQVETAVFNQALERWLVEYPPPYGPRTRFKIRYGLQTSANPVRFALFVSRPQAITEPYLAYIRNKIRRDLGVSQIPLELEVRAARSEERRRVKTRVRQYQKPRA